MHSTASSAPQQIRRPGPLFNWLAVITLIYLILVAVGAVSHGFKGFSGGAEGADQRLRPGGIADLLRDQRPVEVGAERHAADAHPGRRP